MLALESDIAIFGSTPLAIMSLMRAFLVGLATFVSFLSCMAISFWSGLIPFPLYNIYYTEPSPPSQEVFSNKKIKNISLDMREILWYNGRRTALRDLRDSEHSLRPAAARRPS